MSSNGDDTATSVRSVDSVSHKMKHVKPSINTKDRTFIQRRNKSTKNVSLEKDKKFILSVKDINHDSIIANKNMVEGYVLDSKIPPYSPSLVTRYRATELSTKKKVIIKYSPYSLDQTTPMSKFLNEWFLLSGYNPKVPNEKWMDSVSNFGNSTPISLPKGIKGILYPADFFYSQLNGSSALIYDNESGLHNLKELFMTGFPDSSPRFLDERSPSSSSLRSLESFSNSEHSEKVIDNSTQHIVNILEIMISVLKTLKIVHDLGFTNNGLTTLSIFVSETKEVFIEGWDFAFARPFESCTKGYRATNKELTAWLLPYTSPEATGSFNRLCDYKSDFYSIGVILYELFVGFLPFQSADAAKVISLHLFQQPIAPYLISSHVPERLSRVVMKCLEKLAINRFNDCNEIINEMILCISELTYTSISDPNYPYRTTLRFLNPKNTYNREPDLKKLIETYEATKNEIANIYITGEKGAGKTSILGDFKTHLAVKRGILFAEWHHQKFRNCDSTYSMFVSMIRQVLSLILSSTSKTIKKWRDIIVSNIDDDLRIVQDTFPELKQLIGPKHLAMAKEDLFVGENQLDLLPAKFESRFVYIIKIFFALFATHGLEGLTLIIDDYQFQHENETFLFNEIIQFMVNRNGLKHPAKMRVISSLLLGDGARGSYQSFQSLTPENLHLNDERSHFIELSPINYEAVRQCVADFLPLSELPMHNEVCKLIYDKFLYHKTPLVLRTALAKLVLAQAFKIKDNKAVFNFQNALRLIPNDTSDYYESYCSRFISKDNTNVLKYAACVCSGYSFSLYKLSVVSGMSILEAYVAAYKAVSTGLFSSLGIDYKVPFHLFGEGKLAAIPEEKIIQLASTCLFEFGHDTLQDFILGELMTSDEVKRYHRLCALRSYERIENLEDLKYAKFIYVTRHFIESIDVATEEDHLIYSEVLIYGGRLAYENYDFELALTYFQAANLFNDFGSDEEERLETTGKLDLTIVQLQFTLRNYEECMSLIDDLLPSYEVDVDIISFLMVKLRSLYAMGRDSEGITVALRCLRMLGVDIKEDEEWNLNYNLKLKPRIPLSVTEIRSLASKPAKTDTAHELMKAEVLSSMIIPVMGSERTALSKTLVYIGVIDIIENGYFPTHSLLLIILALYFAEGVELGSFYKAIEYTNVAVKMIQDGDASVDLGTTVYELYCAGMAIYSEPIEIVSKYYDVFIENNRAFTDSLIELTAFLSTGVKNVLMVVAGTQNLNSILLKNSGAIHNFKLHSKNQQNERWNTMGIQFLKCLTGTLPIHKFEIEKSATVDFSETQIMYLHYVMKFFLCYLLGEYETAIVILFQSLPSWDRIFTISCYKIVVVYFGCLLLLKLPGKSESEKLERSKMLDELTKHLEIFAETCPANFDTKYMLVKAVMSSKSSTESTVDILDMFEATIEKAVLKGQLLEEALAYELCANWLLETASTNKRSSKMMKEAVRVYNLWGCPAKVGKLSEEFHEIVHDYNWAGVGLLSPSSDRGSPAGPKAGAPFELLLSSIFKNDQAVHTSSDETDYYEAKNVSVRRSSSESTIVDIKTAMNTCLAISEAVDRTTILTKLANSAMELLDGDYAIVALKDKVGDLYLECAVSNKKVRVIDHEPLNSRNDICPIFLIRDTFEKGQVINREEDPIFFDNNYTDQDYYYQNNTATAAVCLPIRDQKEIIGALYLEHQHLTRSRTICFNSDKIDIAVLFCTQLAFSLYKASLYQQMDFAVNLAKTATEEKANFLNSMSHEIRTPFNSLLSCALFLLDTELTDVQRDYVETIRNSSIVTLNIIDGILSFAKIENSSVTLDEIPFSINDCIQSALQLVSEQAATKDLELIHLNNCENIDMIIGDITRFRQVIVNIVGNAVKFTSSGHIAVTTNCHRVSIDNRYELNITVEDTGIGIPKDSHNKVFGAFSQVDGSARRVYGGAGLGLAISKKIIDIMGGSLTFESEENVGTTFTFSLIVKAEMISEKVPQIGTSNKILIVDPNELTRLSLEKEVSRYGFEVSKFDNIDELLQNCAQYKFVFIRKKLINDSCRLRLHDMIKKTTGTKFVLMGQFGTIKVGNFNRILLLPFVRQKVYEIISPNPGLVKDVEPSKTDAPSAKLADTHPLNILLAEDNMINTKVTLQHLKRMGYQADHAADGLIALQKCEERVKTTGNNYDVILMDIQMPNMDGIESCTRLMELYGSNDLLKPDVIALTANVVGDDRQRCKASGMTNFISKPLLPDDLAQLLLCVRTRTQKQ